MIAYDLLPGVSRVWIYQSNRPLSDEEVRELRPIVQQFVTQWVSHNRQLSAYGDVLHHRFIVLMVDESKAGASGCSIDSSVHFMKQVENRFGIDLFDRMRFSYKSGDQVETVSSTDFGQLFKAGKIDDNTLVFDNLVATKDAYESGWLKPLKDSWHKRFV